MSRFRTSQARDTPVAALVTKSERLPPNIMVVPSISMHPPPTLAGRPTGKAVLALLVRSRRLHGHAPWPRSGARRRLWRQKLRDDLRVLWLDHRVLCLFHLPWSWEQWERPPRVTGERFQKSEESCVRQACNKPPTSRERGAISRGRSQERGKKWKDKRLHGVTMFNKPKSGQHNQTRNTSKTHEAYRRDAKRPHTKQGTTESP